MFTVTLRLSHGGSFCIKSLWCSHSSRGTWRTCCRLPIASSTSGKPAEWWGRPDPWWFFKEKTRETLKYGRIACEGPLDGCDHSTGFSPMEHSSQGLNEDADRCCYNSTCSTETYCISVTNNCNYFHSLFFVFSEVKESLLVMVKQDF